MLSSITKLFNKDNSTQTKKQKELNRLVDVLKTNVTKLEDMHKITKKRGGHG
jgi:hypothetical protein